MKYSNFVFESVDWLYYSLHKITLKRGGSYIKSPEWLRNKRATINLKSTDNKYFRDAITTVLNYNEIPNHHERISNLMSFFDQYNWKGIEFPSHLKNWKKIEANNKTIALNILFLKYNTKQMEPAYKSKYNHKRENQVNLLKITDGVNNRHYLAVKSLSRLFRGITSNNNGDYYCLNCFHSYRTNNVLKNMKDYVIKIICVI